MVLTYFEGLTPLSDGAVEPSTFPYLTEKQIVGKLVLSIANDMQKPFKYCIIVTENQVIRCTSSFVISQV